MEENYKEQYEIFEKSFQLIDLNYNEKLIESLINYANSVMKYNENTNITGSKTIKDFIIRHIIDSIAAYKYFVSSKKVLDVGSGSGVPGIPLALIYEEIEFTLCESKIKKSKFLESIKLKNVKVCNKNVYEIKECFDTITAKAFSDMKTLVKIYKMLRTKNGVLIAYKGRLETIKEELKEANLNIGENNSLAIKIEAHEIKTPFIDEERYIVILR